MTEGRIFLSRCQRLGSCGFPWDCMCDVDPTDMPRKPKPKRRQPSWPVRLTVSAIVLSIALAVSWQLIHG